MHMPKAAQIVEQHLNRCRAAYRKGEELKSLIALAEALKLMIQHKIHSMDMQRIGNLVRENLGNVTGIAKVKEMSAQPLSWSKGQEKKLLAALVPIIKAMQEDQRRESMEAMRERKLKIDRALLGGTRYLERGMIKEAQQSFREAVDIHVDEDALFLMIAERLQAAGFYSESFEHLRKALEVDPNSRRACEMLYEAAVKTKDLKRGMEYFQRAQKKSGDTAHVLFGLARLSAAGKRYDQALTLGRRAFELGPDIVQLKKFLRTVEQKGGEAA
jgi:tetratricopeptide (TPR) repeat protein